VRPRAVPKKDLLGRRLCREEEEEWARGAETEEEAADCAIARAVAMAMRRQGLWAMEKLWKDGRG
jgi:hypothetical protein